MKSETQINYESIRAFTDSLDQELIRLYLIESIVRRLLYADADTVSDLWLELRNALGVS